jgi:hypothetical protein
MVDTTVASMMGPGRVSGSKFLLTLDGNVSLVWFALILRRAVHLSTVHAKLIAGQFYGLNHSKAYFAGCSSGKRKMVG